MRLDHYLALHFSQYSRSRLGKHIRSAHILVNKKTMKPGYRLRLGDIIEVDFPPLIDENEPQAQPVDFQVLYEDESLLVINKPPGLVVHPAAGHADNTLVNGLLHRYPDMSTLEGGRPGIVHRLDKDTSGILLVARTEQVQALLSAAFKERKISKTYHALLLRSPAEKSGRIVAPIGRHPVQRKKMSIRSDGRYAATNWKILEIFPDGPCFAEIDIETGRTHQIRVHLASVGLPILGDPVYGRGRGTLPVAPPERPALHAAVGITEGLVRHLDWYEIRGVLAVVFGFGHILGQRNLV